MRIIAVTNQKSRVAKTTTAINLAAGLAREGKKVLIVDLDPQGQSTAGLGIQKEAFESTIGDVIEKHLPIKDAIINTSVDNLAIVPAHIHLDRVEQQLVQTMFREGLLKTALANLNGNGFDYCIIDCRPTLGVLTVNAIYAADFFVIPFEAVPGAFDGFPDLIDTVGEIKGKSINLRALARILVTKYDRRNKRGSEGCIQALEPYKELMFKSKIRKDEAINQSRLEAKTIYDFMPISPGAQDYEAFVEEFVRICGPR